MLIRPFSPNDAGAVNAVALAAFAQYEAVYDDWQTLARGVGSMASLAEDGDIFVAEGETGSIVGGVAYFGPGKTPRAEFFEDDWPIIRMLVVEPSARNSGVGRALTEKCVSRARHDGARVIALHTSPAMEVALSMYLKMGFKLDRHVPDRFGVPYAVYLMSVCH